MSKFVTRPVNIVDLPLAPRASVLRPENVILRFKGQTTMDIGALCFLRREDTKEQGPRKAAEGRKVELSSFCQQRAVHIRAFIVFISDQISFGSKQASTLHNSAQHFARFLTWADASGHSDLLNSIAAARLAVLAYAEYIRKRVLTHEISTNHGAVTQRCTFSILAEFLDAENLVRGVNLLSKTSADCSTEPPSQGAQARMLSLCEALFSGLTELVLEAKPYPFEVVVPDSLGYENNRLWIFPASAWCMPSERLAEISTNGAFNYREGRLNTLAELMAFNARRGKRKRTSEMLRAAEALLVDVNSDPAHWHRRFMGIMALNAFIPMFLSRTGINWEQAVKLLWEQGNVDVVSTIRQRFRAIKQRAGAKMVHYQLPLQFMPAFRRFLELRKFLLADTPDFEPLFFTRGNRATSAPTSLRTSLHITNKFLQRIDPKITPITSRGWRAAKSDWLISKTDISTAAQLLQNSEQTIVSSYASGSIEAHRREMSQFLDSIILNKDVQSKTTVDSAVGGCVSYGNPADLPGPDPIVKPDCGNPDVGCLFCDKFKVHADEIDVRKLLSCQYCLINTSHLSGFYLQSRPIIERIQAVLNEIHSRDSSLVPRITREVNEGELDAYWASKYDMLLRLHLINDPKSI